MTFSSGRKWDAAVREHESVLEAFVRAIEGVPAQLWHRPPAEGKWPASALALHVRQAYEIGRSAANGGDGMRIRSPRPVVWLSRHILLPLMLATKRFPADAPAPRETRPDLSLANHLTQAAAVETLRHEAAAALEALRNPTASSLTHAYFGSLTPLVALRLLSAHTRHHTGGMIARGAS